MNVQTPSDLLTSSVQYDYFVLLLDQQKVTESESHEIKVILANSGPQPQIPNEYSFFFNIEYIQMPEEELKES